MRSLFPSLYDLFMMPLEKTRFKKVRKQLVESAKGRVLEIGSGTGINFPHYKKAIQVDAIEPNLIMCKRSMKRVNKASMPIEVYMTKAETLPFDRNTFDTIVATLVFCTIPDPLKALEEIRRVAKPGAEILLFEHVQMQHPLFRKAQNILNPLWKKVAGGCHLNRDTLKVIKQSGFEIMHVNHFYSGLFISIRSLNKK